MLLICVLCLSPMDIVSIFYKEKLVQLAQLYPSDFSKVEVLTLKNQLETYVIDVRSLVRTRNDILYPLVYRLITLALSLPISTATVERIFFTMKIVKTCLCNKICGQFLTDCLVTYIEKISLIV